MPQNPDIWPTKLELGSVPRDLEPLNPTTADNYPSVENFPLSRPFWMRGTWAWCRVLSTSVTGCSPEDLCVGAMAGIQEPDKVRTIFDIMRANTDKKTTAPTLYDLLTARLHLTQGPFTLFKSNVSKAHRRINLQRKDWKYMIATIKDKFWVNMVGTYGVASAQLYWGRLGSLHLRPDLLFWVVFVDDFMALLGQNAAESACGIVMLFFTLLGCPISWRKSLARLHGGHQ